MKKILYNRESPQLLPLRNLIEKQKHRTLVLWVIDCSERILAIFEDKYPEDNRPRKAVEAAKDWASGKIKMTVAKKAALESHNAATEVQSDLAACAAARAMGHVVGTVHVETHAIGVVMYGMTAFYHHAKDNKDKVILKECNLFLKRLLYWEKNIDKVNNQWAGFLLRDNVQNKEMLLRLKKEQKLKKKQDKL